LQCCMAAVVWLRSAGLRPQGKTRTRGRRLQQDLDITLSASMGMIGVPEITLIVPTLCAHRYTSPQDAQNGGQNESG
ncbi:hypothetical protein, partial [Pseudomonas viridiflava]|uniref:hypothetical protein n=1 Tax=Pseudomonas viridiflava TaxID=33069 RepID=UPI0019808C6F